MGNKINHGETSYKPPPIVEYSFRLGDIIAYDTDRGPRTGKLIYIHPQGLWLMACDEFNRDTVHFTDWHKVKLRRGF